MYRPPHTQLPTRARQRTHMLEEKPAKQDPLHVPLCHGTGIPWLTSKALDLHGVATTRLYRSIPPSLAASSGSSTEPGPRKPQVWEDLPWFRWPSRSPKGATPTRPTEGGPGRLRLGGRRFLRPPGARLDSTSGHPAEWPFVNGRRVPTFTWT